VSILGRQLSLNDDSRVGTCSLCGGDVMAIRTYWGVGPIPRPQCNRCGAVMDSPMFDDVVPMRRNPIRNGENKETSK